MKKLEIDVLTGKITGFTDMPADVLAMLNEGFDACGLRKLCQNVNFPIYKEDVFVGDDEISASDVLEGKSYYIDGVIVKKEEETTDELQELQKEYMQEDAADESKLFMDYIMSGKDLKEARELIEVRRTKLESMKNKIAELEDERNRKTEEYWMKKNRETDPKTYMYYTAAVLLIKDENRYLEEWIEWHLVQGIEHIYIYDNGLKESVTEVTGKYADKITVVEWKSTYDNMQEEAYNHFLSNYRQDVKWVIFLDSDEFLRPETEQGLEEMLKDLEDYTEIYGSFETHNANGAEEYSDEAVRVRFTEITDVDNGIYYKNFVQANRVDSMIRHYAFYDPKRHKEYKNENDNQDLFVIEHYYTKSWEEWKEKILERGSCDPTYKRKLKEFFEYNPDMQHLNDGTNVVQKYQNQ